MKHTLIALSLVLSSTSYARNSYLPNYQGARFGNSSTTYCDLHTEIDESVSQIYLTYISTAAKTCDLPGYTIIFNCSKNVCREPEEGRTLNLLPDGNIVYKADGIAIKYFSY